MKKYYQKNILKRVFSALVIFLWGFTVNGIPPQPEQFTPEQFKPAQKAAYNSLPEPEQQNLINFLTRLKNAPICKKFVRGKREENFGDVICAINGFVNLQEDPQIRKILKFIMGFALLDDGVIATNTQNWGVFTDRCKSSINGCLGLLGFSFLPRNDELIEREFHLLNLSLNRSEIRQWSLRKSSIPPTVNPNSEDQNPSGELNQFVVPHPLPTVNPNSEDQNPSGEPSQFGKPNPSGKPNPFEDLSQFWDL
jgi:hypothetical protein